MLALTYGQRQVAHRYKNRYKRPCQSATHYQVLTAAERVVDRKRFLQHEVSFVLLYCRADLPPSILPFNASQLLSVHHNQLHSNANNNSGDTVTFWLMFRARHSLQVSQQTAHRVDVWVARAQLHCSGKTPVHAERIQCVTGHVDMQALMTEFPA